MQAAYWARGPQTGASSPICVRDKGTANSGGDVREGFPGRQLFPGAGHVGATLGEATGVWAAKTEAKHAERGRQGAQAQDAQGRAYKKGLALYPGMPGAAEDL